MVEDIVIENLNTSERLPLSMLTTPFYILESVDWGTIQSTHYSYKFINQIGVYISGTYLGIRNINIIGWIIASSEEEMDLRKDYLNKLINPQNSFRCYYKSYELDFLLSETIKYSATSKENNEVVCKFQISGVCPNPLFKSVKEKREEIAVYHPKFHFPLTISETPNPPKGIVFGERSREALITIVNEGSVSTGFKIVFKAIGAVSSPYLVNAKTREFMRINSSMEAGQEIVINTVLGEKKITSTKEGGETENYFKNKDLGSSWLQLEVGENIFGYGALENVDNLEILLYHQDKWLEVQGCK